MASLSLEDVLKKLNKGKAEEDKVKTVLDLGSLNLDFCSSGSAYLDLYMDNKVVPLGAMTLLTGWEGSGKSSIALIMGRELQKKTGKTVVILDGEQTITDSHIERFGLDTSKLVVYRDSVLENMLDTAEAFSQSDDICAIIIDSVKAFYSIAVEAKSAEDYSIGIEAKKFGTRFPIINANCARRGIAFIPINQWRENPGAMGSDPRVLPGGQWNKYMPFTHLDFTKKDLIKDENKNVIGHKLDVRVRKSKAGAFDKKEVITLNFYYGGGFEEKSEYAQIFCETSVAKQGGAGWITFPDRFGEEKKVQGTDKFAEYLKANPEDFEFLKQQLK
jgi:RecA/RadA recombinase